MNDAVDWLGPQLDPTLMGYLAQAMRAYQQVAQMQAAIAQNDDDMARLEWTPTDLVSQQAQLETLRFHTSIMREHLERRLEPARQQAVAQLLEALDEAGQQTFRATLRQLAEPPAPVSVSFMPLVPELPGC